ncbi:MAG: 5-formyltetrahydrofolate cyclo-ligase [Clostridiaceae bacterium]
MKENEKPIKEESSITDEFKAEQENELANKKRLLRKELNQRQCTLSKEYKEEASVEIARKVFESKEYQDAETIFIYSGTANEVDTSIIIKDALNRGKHVALPKIVTLGIMEALEIESMEELVPERHGILEPKEGSRIIQPEEIDLALIPCLGFSSDGYRIGYGGGFYDRFLPQGNFTKIIIAFEKMSVDDLPVSAFDHQVDKIITESSIVDVR